MCATTQTGYYTLGRADQHPDFGIGKPMPLEFVQEVLDVVHAPYSIRERIFVKYAIAFDDA